MTLVDIAICNDYLPAFSLKGFSTTTVAVFRKDSLQARSILSDIYIYIHLSAKLFYPKSPDSEMKELNKIQIVKFFREVVEHKVRALEKSTINKAAVGAMFCG